MENEHNPTLCFFSRVDPTEVIKTLSEDNQRFAYLGCSLVDLDGLNSFDMAASKLLDSEESRWFGYFLKALKSIRAYCSENLGNHVSEMVQCSFSIDNIKWAEQAISQSVIWAYQEGCFDWEASAYELVEASLHLSVALGKNVTCLLSAICELCASRCVDRREEFDAVCIIDMCVYLSMQAEPDITYAAEMMRCELTAYDMMQEMDLGAVDEIRMNRLDVSAKFVRRALVEYEAVINEIGAECCRSRLRKCNSSVLISANHEASQCRIRYEHDPTDENLEYGVEAVRRYLSLFR